MGTPVDAVQPGTIRLRANEVYVRAAPKSLVTGTLERGDHFEVVAFSPGKGGQRWAWGHARGDAAQAGWVLLGTGKHGYFKQVDHTPDINPGPPKDLSQQHLPFVRLKDRKDGLMFTRKAEVTAEGAHIFGNYNPKAGPADPVWEFYEGDQVGVRYSPHPGWVIVFKHESGSDPVWGYMNLDHLRMADDPKFKAWQRRNNTSDKAMFGVGSSKPDGGSKPDSGAKPRKQASASPGPTVDYQDGSKLQQRLWRQGARDFRDDKYYDTWTIDDLELNYSSKHADYYRSGWKNERQQARIASSSEVTSQIRYEDGSKLQKKLYRRGQHDQRSGFYDDIHVDYVTNTLGIGHANYYRAGWRSEKAKHGG